MLFHWSWAKESGHIKNYSKRKKKEKKNECDFLPYHNFSIGLIDLGMD